MRADIVSVNGLSPIRRQAIIWINAVLLLYGPLGTNKEQKRKLFIHENAYESVVWEMADILSRGRWVNTYSITASRSRYSIEHPLQWNVIAIVRNSLRWNKINANRT